MKTIEITNDYFLFGYNIPNRLKPINRKPNLLWKTSNSNIISIVNISNKHIINIIRCFENPNKSLSIHNRYSAISGKEWVHELKLELEYRRVMGIKK